MRRDVKNATPGDAMKLKTNILVSVSAILILASAVIFFRFVTPFVRTSDVLAVYTVGEDFKNAAVYRPLFGKNRHYLYLPESGLSFRWWAIDFEGEAIYRPNTPRSLLSMPYVLRSDTLGVSLNDRVKNRGEWTWSFTARGVSFAGNGVTCTVIK